MMYRLVKNTYFSDGVSLHITHLKTIIVFQTGWGLIWDYINIKRILSLKKIKVTIFELITRKIHNSKFKRK